MRTMLNISKSGLFAVAIALSALPISSPAAPMIDGGTSGGGTAKPASSFGRENFQAILENPEIAGIMGLSFAIEEIKLLDVTDQGYQYSVLGRTRDQSRRCSLDVTVWNTDASLVSEVRVVNVTVISGCQVRRPTPKESVTKKYETEFRRFPQGLNENQSYGEYLNAARAIAPEVRREMREYMKQSESKYYEVYTANGKQLADFFRLHPNATVSQAMYQLAKAMKLDVSGGGIQMPLIVGLTLAPVFIVDN